MHKNALILALLSSLFLLSVAAQSDANYNSVILFSSSSLAQVFFICTAKCAQKPNCEGVRIYQHVNNNGKKNRRKGENFFGRRRPPCEINDSTGSNYICEEGLHGSSSSSSNAEELSSNCTVITYKITMRQQLAAVVENNTSTKQLHGDEKAASSSNVNLRFKRSFAALAIVNQLREIRNNANNSSDADTQGNNAVLPAAGDSEVDLEDGSTTARESEILTTITSTNAPEGMGITNAAPEGINSSSSSLEQIAESSTTPFAPTENDGTSSSSNKSAEDVSSSSGSSEDSSVASSTPDNVAVTVGSTEPLISTTAGTIDPASASVELQTSTPEVGTALPFSSTTMNPTAASDEQAPKSTTLALEPIEDEAKKAEVTEAGLESTATSATPSPSTSTELETSSSSSTKEESQSHRPSSTMSILHATDIVSTLSLPTAVTAATSSEPVVATSTAISSSDVTVNTTTRIPETTLTAATVSSTELQLPETTIPASDPTVVAASIIKDNNGGEVSSTTTGGLLPSEATTPTEVSSPAETTMETAALDFSTVPPSSSSSPTSTADEEMKPTTSETETSPSIDLNTSTTTPIPAAATTMANLDLVGSSSSSSRGDEASTTTLADNLDLTMTSTLPPPSSEATTTTNDDVILKSTVTVTSPAASLLGEVETEENTVSTSTIASPALENEVSTIMEAETGASTSSSSSITPQSEAMDLTVPSSTEIPQITTTMLLPDSSSPLATTTITTITEVPIPTSSIKAETSTMETEAVSTEEPTFSTSAVQATTTVTEAFDERTTTQAEADSVRSTLAVDEVELGSSTTKPEESSTITMNFYEDETTTNASYPATTMQPEGLLDQMVTIQPEGLLEEMKAAAAAAGHHKSQPKLNSTTIFHDDQCEFEDIEKFKRNIQTVAFGWSAHADADDDDRDGNDGKPSLMSFVQGSPCLAIFSKGQHVKHGIQRIDQLFPGLPQRGELQVAGFAGGKLHFIYSTPAADVANTSGIGGTGDQLIFSFKYEPAIRKYFSAGNLTVAEFLRGSCGIELPSEYKVKSFLQLPASSTCLLFNETSRVPLISPNATEGERSLAVSIHHLLKTEFVNYVQGIFAWEDEPLTAMSTVYVWGSNGELYTMRRDTLNHNILTKDGGLQVKGKEQVVWKKGDYELIPYEQFPI